MDMIFGSDIGKANIAAMDNEKCKDVFINVATGIETSVIELLDIITYHMKKITGNKSINISLNWGVFLQRLYILKSDIMKK